MSKLDEIGIRVVEGKDDDSSDSALALLHEIFSMLQQLLEEGESGVLDLRAMPLLAEEYHYLEQVLGEGEVNATLEALGSSKVRETAIPGVWWITHHDSGGEVIAELIEVTIIPAILKSDPVDISDGITKLQAHIDRER